MHETFIENTVKNEVLSWTKERIIRILNDLDTDQKIKRFVNKNVKLADETKGDSLITAALAYVACEVENAETKIFELFLNSATNYKNPLGYLYAGIHYLYGIGIEKDYNKAFDFFRNAQNEFPNFKSSFDSPTSHEFDILHTQELLFLCYWKGYGTEQNQTKVDEMLNEWKNTKLKTGPMPRNQYLIEHDDVAAMIDFFRAVKPLSTLVTCKLQRLALTPEQKEEITVTYEFAKLAASKGSEEGATRVTSFENRAAEYESVMGVNPLV